jgi:DNA-binding phage protein
MASVRAVMKEVLRKAPGSIRSLATEAGLSRTALRLAASGEINLTAESVQKVVRALRRWGDRCDQLADKLERAAEEDRG